MTCLLFFQRGNMIKFKLCFDGKIFEFTALSDITENFTTEELKEFQSPINIIVGNVTVGIINPYSLAIAANNL